MRPLRWMALLAIVLAAGALGYAIGTRTGAGASSPTSTGETLWTCSMHPQVLQNKPGACPICGMQLTPVRKEAGTQGDRAGDRRIKYWWDPMMQPPYISDKPGKSPMGMDLVPVYEDEVRAGPTVTIDPVLTQNMGIRVAPVEEGPLTLSIRTVGYLREAETRQHDISIKVEGWIEKLHADTEGMFVQEGDPLFELYSPELLVAQEELLAATRAVGRLPAGADERLRQESARLVESGRRKLALWDVPPSEIDRLLESGQPASTIAFRSPASGFVTEKSVVRGSAVEPGMKILRITDQSELWMDARIYESRIPYVRIGQKARASLQGRPEREFEGEVVFISPRIDAMTRAAVARVAFPNPGLVLKPGMFATVDLSFEVRPRALLVPRESVIDTGVRQIAFVVLDRGRFEPRRVRMGLETGDGRAEILEGLAPGERVVVSGQFLLDSESRLREAIDKMTGDRLLHPPAPSRAGVHADPLLKPYFAMSRELVQGRTVAPAAVEAFAEEVRALAEKAGDAAPHVEEAGREAASLRGRDLKGQREAFKKLSEKLILLLGHFPATRAAAPRLYVIHCPMAQASWVQESDEIANPYFGDEMLECGEVTKTLETVRP